MSLLWFILVFFTFPSLDQRLPKVIFSRSPMKKIIAEKNSSRNFANQTLLIPTWVTRWKTNDFFHLRTKMYLAVLQTARKSTWGRNLGKSQDAGERKSKVYVILFFRITNNYIVIIIIVIISSSSSIYFLPIYIFSLIFMIWENRSFDLRHLKKGKLGKTAYHSNHSCKICPLNSVLVELQWHLVPTLYNYK